MPTGYLRRHLIIGIGVFLFAAVVSFGFGTAPVSAAGLGGSCSSNADCSEGDCATEGSCACNEEQCVATAAGDEAPSTGTGSDICRIDVLEDPVGSAQCVAFMVIEFFLRLVVMLLGFLLTMTLNVMMAFATYNAFSTAPVVQTGWVIVRDIVNMFFIIILLVSAFATIVGAWEDFNYRRVLPKLLLMAILINFSRTLIQLLIDFSQVVMLTFVNAFQSASQGNFVNALRINEAVQLSSGGSPTGTDLANVIIAWMLAIFMLSIALAVVIILTLYFVVRIIGLWIALIFSPVAFFATALPDRLKRGLDSFTGKYWQRLVSMLTGGPVIAFFLWLTLATVQESAGAGGLAPALNFGSSPIGNPFLTEIGNSNQIASFIVAIAMLMTGLEAAVTSAQAVSATLGKVAGEIGGAGGALGRVAAFAPFLAAGYGARYAARGGAAAYRGLDKRLDITGGISRRALGELAAAQQRGGITGRAAGLIGRAARPTLMRGAVMRRKEAEVEKKEKAGLYEDLEKYGGAGLAQATANAFGGPSILKTLGENRATEVVKAAASSDDVTKAVVDERVLNLKQKKDKAGVSDYEKMLKAYQTTHGLTEDEAKAAIETSFKNEATANQRNLVTSRIAFAKARGDAAELDKLDKLVTSNPELAAEAERAAAIKKLALADPERLKEVNKWNAYNGEVLTGLMMQNGFKQNARGGLDQTDQAAWDRFKRAVKDSGNKELLEGLEAHELMVLASPNQSVDSFKSVQHNKNKKDGSMRAFATKDISVVAGTSPTGAPVIERLGAGGRFRNDVQRQSLKSLQSDNTTRPAGYVPSSAEMATAFKSGATFNDVLTATSNAGDTPQEIATGIVQANASRAQAALAQRTPQGGINEAAFNDAMQNLDPILTQIDNTDVTSDMQVKFALGLTRGGLKDIVKKDGFTFVAKEIRPKILKTLRVMQDRVNDIRKMNQAQLTADQRELLTWYQQFEREAEQRNSDLASAIRNQVRRPT